MKILNPLVYKSIFFLVIIFYILNYIFWGIDDADGGYTMALSWRIINGEIPYKDFIMVRPPLSPLFHALFMFSIPSQFQIIADRIIFYLLMATSSILCAKSLEKTIQLNIQFNDTWLLATVGFIFSVRNFPPMGWHTVDGIFFASAGAFYLITRRNPYSDIFGVLLLFLSALCKQPFYLMPIIGLFYIFLQNKNCRLSLIPLAFFLSITIIFFLLLVHLNILKLFLAQTSNSTRLSDLVNAGLLSYIDFNRFYFILLTFFVISSFYSKTKFTFKNNINLLPYLFITTLLLFPAIKFWRQLSNSSSIPITFGYTDNGAEILFILTMMFLITQIRNISNFLPLIFMMLISWCSSISWGYQSPHLYCTPLIIGFLITSKSLYNSVNIKRLSMYTLILGFVIYYSAYNKPYCNPPKSELIYKLDTAFPKARYLKISKESYQKYAELKDLITKYGNNFKTLPGMPLANYLNNSKSPIQLDWVFNAETSQENKSIVKQLTTKNVVVFLEKEPLFISVHDSNSKFNSSVAHQITKEWTKVDSTWFFYVYRIQKTSPYL
jgi:hypothetical protein